VLPNWDHAFALLGAITKSQSTDQNGALKPSFSASAAIVRIEGRDGPSAHRVDKVAADEHSELEPGLISFAAPIRDAKCMVVATLNVSTHSARTTPKRAQADLLPPLMRTAEMISHALGLKQPR
jgi:hypothetical protein